MWSSLFLLLCVIVNVLSDTPPFITKCILGDNKCLKQSMAKAIPSFANGLPDLNVETLDPMFVPYVDATTANIKFLVSNLTITGLKNCDAEKLTMDVPKEKFTLKILCTVKLAAQYELDGQLLLFSIRGNGNVRAILKKIEFTAEVYTNDFNDTEGKKHWLVKSYKYNYNLKDKSVLKFENLFPNNEFLRKTTNNLIDMNSNDVVNELGPPIITSVIDKVLKNIENFFGVLALKDLILDYDKN